MKKVLGKGEAPGAWNVALKSPTSKKLCFSNLEFNFKEKLKTAE